MPFHVLLRCVSSNHRLLCRQTPYLPFACDEVIVVARPVRYLLWKIPSSLVERIASSPSPALVKAQNTMFICLRSLDTAGTAT